MEDLSWCNKAEDDIVDIPYSSSCQGSKATQWSILHTSIIISQWEYEQLMFPRS